MDQIAIWAAALSLAAWIYLAAFRSGFWRPDQRLAGPATAERRWPDVVAIIPARNEAATIGAAIRSHLECGYPGRYCIVLVDDQSWDGTGRLVEELSQGAARQVTVVRAPDLEAGWTGKLRALDIGLSVAADQAATARYVLFTDGDIVHGRETLGRLVAKAERDGLMLVSLMAKLDSRGLWGTLLVPAFVFFFQKLYPFARVNGPADWTAAAAGGCMLVRRSTLEDAGGLAEIKAELIDDCALARLIKGRPPTRRIWLGLADDVVSLRDNRALGAIWSMVSRTAYTQLDHSPILLVGTIAGMALVYLAGPIAVLALPLHGSTPAAALGAAAWIAMALVYRPTLAYHAKPAPVALTLPVAACFYLMMTISSAIQHWRGEGAVWKGRSYKRRRSARSG